MHSWIRVLLCAFFPSILLSACDTGDESEPDPTPINKAPSANNINITDDNGGIAVVGDDLTGAYSYVDSEGDLEATSTFRWLRNSDVIDGATSLSYKLVASDAAQQIFFEVTPFAASGTLMGTASQSSSLAVDSNPNPVLVGEIIFTEIMPNPNVLSDALGEWFELYNVSNKSLDLKDCVVMDKSSVNFLIATTVNIPSGSYRSFAKSNSPGFTPDYAYPVSLILNNSDESLSLTCSGIEIDKVTYAASTAGNSLSLDENFKTASSNDNADNWCEGPGSYNGDFGTPGAVNNECP